MQFSEEAQQLSHGLNSTLNAGDPWRYIANQLRQPPTPTPEVRPIPPPLKAPWPSVLYGTKGTWLQFSLYYSLI